MEQLIKDLKELGYELVYYEPLDAWRVVDSLGGFNGFLPSAFSKIVFKHGYIFSVCVTFEGNGLCVKFEKR